MTAAMTEMGCLAATVTAPLPVLVGEGVTVVILMAQEAQEDQGDPQIVVPSQRETPQQADPSG